MAASRSKLGIETALLKLLVQIGRDEKLDRIIGSVLLENHPMQHVCKKVGFTLNHDLETGDWRAVIELTPQFKTSTEQKRVKFQQARQSGEPARRIMWFG